MARVESKVKVNKPTQEKDTNKRKLPLVVLITSITAVIAIIAVIVVLVVQNANKPDLSNKFPGANTVTYEELEDLAQFSEHNIYVFVYHADLDKYPVDEDVQRAVKNFIKLDDSDDDNAAFYVLDLSEVNEDDELINEAILNNKKYGNLASGPFLIKIEGEKVDKVISTNLYNQLIAAMKDFEELM